MQELSTKNYRVIVCFMTVRALRTMLAWGQFVARLGWHLVMLLPFGDSGKMSLGRAVHSHGRKLNHSPVCRNSTAFLNLKKIIN